MYPTRAAHRIISAGPPFSIAKLAKSSDSNPNPNQLNAVDWHYIRGLPDRLLALSVRGPLHGLQVYLSVPLRKPLERSRISLM